MLASALRVQKHERDDWFDAYGQILGHLVESWESTSVAKEEISMLKTSVDTLMERLNSERIQHKRSQAKVVQRVEEALKAAGMLQGELKVKEAEVDDLKVEVEYLKKNNNDVKSELLRLEEKCSTMTSERDDLLSAASAYEAKINLLSNEVDKARENNSMQTEDLVKQHEESLREFEVRAQREAHSLQAALASSEMDAQIASRQLQEKTKELELVKQAKLDLEKKLQSLQEDFDASRAEMDYELSDVRATLSETKEALSNTQHQLTAAKQSYQSLQSSLEELKANQNRLIQEEVQKEKTSLRKRISELESDLHEVTTQLHRATEAAGGAGPLAKEAELMATKAKLEEASDMLSFMEKEVGKLRSTVKERDTEIANVRKQMAMEVNDAAQQVQELLRAQARADRAEAKLQKLMSQIHS